MNKDWEKYKNDILSKLTWQDVYAQIKQQTDSNDEWLTGLCPFHQDTNPSFSFNKKTLSWRCFAGCGHGSVFDFIMKTSGTKFREVLFDIGDRLHIPRPQTTTHRPPISEEKVKEWQSYLSVNKEAKGYLIDERGLTEETITRYCIGWDSKRQRYSIPIRDEHGVVVNVRLCSQKQSPKMINYTDEKYKYGSPARLYGLDELLDSKSKQVIICEGEWDRLILQQEGFCAVTSTHGCNTFRPEWVSYFKDKEVVFIFDCDKQGTKASTEIINKLFKNAPVKSIKNIILPLKGTKDDKDINDYFTKCGSTLNHLVDLVLQEPVVVFKGRQGQEAAIRLQSFTEIEKKHYVDKRVQCDITVCGETSEAFHGVKAFKVKHCKKLDAGQCLNCAKSLDIPINSQIYIGSCMTTNNQLIAMLREYCCEFGQRPHIEITEKTTIKEFFCHQKINRLTYRSNTENPEPPSVHTNYEEIAEKKVYYISSEDVKPGNYSATGYVKTHPKTQQITFLIEHLEPLEDDYQSFSVQENIDHLKAFQEFTWDEIVADLSEHVTKIYNRDEILTALLLTYCSPLYIPFNGEIIRGWMVAAIIGDAGTGKTQTYNRFAEFVNIGDIISGLTGSRTGLAYALVEHKQKGWQVKVGRYPANSGKLLMVDEAHFISQREWRTLSLAMENGFLQIDRVKSQGYESKTRLLLICNPKKDQVMDNFVFGCESLSSLFPATIIRRLDLCVFANSGDMQDISFVNKRRGTESQQQITSTMLRAVIYWVWHLRPDQIVFEEKAVDHCLALANIMAQKFGYAGEIPLINPADCRKTIARIAAAFAAIMLSTNEDFSRLIVTTEHVLKAGEFLMDVYTHDNCALNDYSNIQKTHNHLVDYEQIRDAFIKKKDDSKHSEQNTDIFVQSIYIIRTSNIIRRDEIAEQIGCSVEAIKNIVFNLINSSRDGYTKTPKFNRFLRRFLKEYPDFFKGKEFQGTLLNCCNDLRYLNIARNPYPEIKKMGLS